MTAAKKLKQAIRARAKQTGESYSVARTHVLAKLAKQRSDRTAEAADVARSAPAKGAVSEAKCIEKTGHGFDHWFGVLDRFGATKLGHTAAARHLKDDHGVSAWYSQSITVAYERARGLREVHQVCGGTFEVSVSRVLPSDLDEVVAALSRKAARERWLQDADDEVAECLAAALASKRFKKRDDVATFQFDGPDGRVDLRATRKDDGRTQLVARTMALASKAQLEVARARWKQTLDSLRAALKAQGGEA